MGHCWWVSTKCPSSSSGTAAVPRPSFPFPRYCNSKLDSTPGTVFLTGRYGWRTSLFCSFWRSRLVRAWCHRRSTGGVARVRHCNRLKIRICLFPPSFICNCTTTRLNLGGSRPFTPLGCPAAWCVLLILFPHLFRHRIDRRVATAICAWLAAIRLTTITIFSRKTKCVQRGRSTYSYGRSSVSE